MFSVCPHLGGGGGVPIPHNALQNLTKCHGAATGGGGVPCQVQVGGVPWWGGAWVGGLPWQGVPWGVPCWGVPRSGTPPARSARGGGYPAGGVPRAGTPPSQVSQRGGGVPRSGLHREYLLHGGQYASCVHAGLSCFSLFVSSHPGGGVLEGYLPWLGVSTLAWGYLPWLGGTYLGQGDTYLRQGHTYLGWGVPMLVGVGAYLGPGGYLPWLGGAYVGQGGYLPWTEEVPTLPGVTYVGPGGYLPWPGSIGSTCYVAGGMPLAFTQEDCLVLFMRVLWALRFQNTVFNLFWWPKISFHFKVQEN